MAAQVDCSSRRGSIGVRRVCQRTAVAVLASIVVWPAVGWAGPHRARLSSDLARHLQRGSNASVDVILSGPPVEVERLRTKKAKTPRRTPATTKK